MTSDARTPNLGRALLTHAGGLVAATAAVSLAALTVFSTRAACASGMGAAPDWEPDEPGGALRNDEPFLAQYDAAETARRFATPVAPGLVRFHVKAAHDPFDFPGAYRLPVVFHEHWPRHHGTLFAGRATTEAEWLATGEDHRIEDPEAGEWADRVRTVVSHRWYADLPSLAALLAALDVATDSLILDTCDDGHAQYSLMLYNGYIE